MRRKQNLSMAFVLLMLFCIPTPSLAAEIPGHGSVKSIQVEREFALFTADWIAKINRNYASRLGNIQVIREESGYFGRYSQVEMDSVMRSVKQVSTSPLTYIGLLEYMEWTYESAALTYEEALQGPFVQVKGRKVTEIFRYGDNRWLD